MVELSHRAEKLLRQMADDGGTLREFIGKWSSWRFIETGAPWAHVTALPVQQLRDAGFIERTTEEIGSGGMGAHYIAFNYTVTDAGRAWLAAFNAPKELT